MLNDLQHYILLLGSSVKAVSVCVCVKIRGATDWDPIKALNTSQKSQTNKFCMVFWLKVEQQLSVKRNKVEVQWNEPSCKMQLLLKFIRPTLVFLLPHSVTWWHIGRSKKKLIFNLHTWPDVADSLCRLKSSLFNFKSHWIQWHILLRARDFKGSALIFHQHAQALSGSTELNELLLCNTLLPFAQMNLSRLTRGTRSAVSDGRSNLSSAVKLVS